MRSEHSLKIRTDIENLGSRRIMVLSLIPNRLRTVRCLSPLPSPHFFGNNGKCLICEKQRTKKYKPGRDLIAVHKL